MLYICSIGVWLLSSSDSWVPIRIWHIPTAYVGGSGDVYIYRDLRLGRSEFRAADGFLSLPLVKFGSCQHYRITFHEKDEYVPK